MPIIISQIAAIALLLLVSFSHAAVQQEKQERGGAEPGRHLRTRIVGGSPVRPGAHPYFAQWQGAQCGATVIHDDILISAAHCYDVNNPPASRAVYLASVTRNTGLLRRYVEVIPHPLYGDDLNESGEDFDVVLIKTAFSMLENSDGTPTGVETIELNRNPAIPEVDDAILAVGYGQTAEDNPVLSDELRDVLLYYIDDDFCTEQYPLGEFNSNLMFCTGVPGGGKDTCQGDSGGPLIHYSSSTLVGVVSFGTGCGRGDYSGVNARLSSVSNWVDEQICELSSYPPDYCRPNPTGGNPDNNGQDNNNNGNSNVVNSATEPASPGVSPPQPTITSSSPANNVAPLYNPRNTDLNSYPGESPRVPTNGVTINVYYENRPLRVTWNLAMQQPTAAGAAGSNNNANGGDNSASSQWRTMYRSIRGEAHSLQSQTFTNIQHGVYRFHLEDPNAATQLGPYDVSIGWMSVMAPRGDLIWGLAEGTENEVRTEYDIYFEVTERGMISYLEGPPPARL